MGTGPYQSGDAMQPVRHRGAPLLTSARLQWHEISGQDSRQGQGEDMGRAIDGALS